MNKLKGTIQSIETSQHFALIDVMCGRDKFASIHLFNENDDTELSVGDTVTVIFKDTEVAIAVNFDGNVSLNNRITGFVDSIESGKLLSRIGIFYEGQIIYSVITTRSTKRLNLVTGVKVTGLVKANELTVIKEN